MSSHKHHSNSVTQLKSQLKVDVGRWKGNGTLPPPMVQLLDQLVEELEEDQDMIPPQLQELSDMMLLESTSARLSKLSSAGLSRFKSDAIQFSSLLEDPKFVTTIQLLLDMSLCRLRVMLMEYTVLLELMHTAESSEWNLLTISGENSDSVPDTNVDVAVKRVAEEIFSPTSLPAERQSELFNEVHQIALDTERPRPGASALVGYCYLHGIGVGRSEHDAVKWLRQAADLGSSMAEYQLGVYYNNPDNENGGDLATSAQWFERAAEHGHAEAQWCVGNCYLAGKGVLKDIAKAVEWIERAAKGKHRSALLQVGKWLEKGENMPCDKKRAVRLYNMAASGPGCFEAAHIALGTCYRDGIGVTPDRTIALREFERAADNGNCEAQRLYALCLQDGSSGEDDELEKVFRYLSEAARGGDAAAQFHLSECFIEGVGTAVDEAKALEWLQKSADGGYGDAQYRLAELYSRTDTKRSFAYYLKAARSSVLARFQVAKCYLDGVGVAADAIMAERYLREADELSEAQYTLGMMYLNGDRIPRSERNALVYLGKAEQQEHPEATYRMGVCARDGVGLTANPAMAFQYFAKAEALRVVPAAYDLALCYANGVGTAVDTARALSLLKQSAEDDNYLPSQLLLYKWYLGDGPIGKDAAACMTVLLGAAKNGDARSQYQLYLQYDNHPDQDKRTKLKPNPDNAKLWLTKAAEAGYRRAQYALGDCYLRGHLLEKDVSLAFSWFSKAASSPDAVPEAAYRLADMLRRGEGVERNEGESIRWLRAAAEYGHTKAQHELGLACRQVNYTEAVQWFMKAAKTVPDAKYQLAICYLMGSGVPSKDPEAAMKLLNELSASGYEPAQRELNQLKSSKR